MENTKIISDNGAVIDVNGIFYIFNSKYYFIYTKGELEENGYVKLYLVQVCKEVQNTQSGPVETGYMLGMEINDQAEWQKVQSSITTIVEDKKNGTQSATIQYLPINMLVNLKVVSNNKFKLLRHIVEDNFKIVLPNNEQATSNNAVYDITAAQTNASEELDSDVIIDYRAKFFEEQEKNGELENQIKVLQEKINNIKTIIQ